MNKPKIPRELINEILTIIAIGLSYIIMHEIGHFIFASYFGLSPSFIHDTNGFFSAVGVSHGPGTAVQEFYVIFGATLLPLLVAIISLVMGYKNKNENLVLVTEIYLVLVLINLLPIPGFDFLDANKMWELIGPLF